MTIAPLAGVISAAPSPSTARATMIQASDWARPQAAEASTKITPPRRNVRSLPMRSPMRPPRATNTAMASR